MGLILKDKLQELMRGYPTVSDKYNVRGGTLASTSDVGHFGDLVAFNGDGFFTVVDEAHPLSDISQLAGVLLATNVKVTPDFFGGYTAEAPTMPGEAFNLAVSGYIALPVAVEGTDDAEPTKAEKEAVAATITEGSDAKITADGKVSPEGTLDAGWKFTGITCIDMRGELLAEVKVFQTAA